MLQQSKTCRRKGQNSKENLKTLTLNFKYETELTEVNPKRMRSVAVSEEDQLPEAWTRGKLISSVSIHNKEDRLVQECWMSDIAV